MDERFPDIPYEDIEPNYAVEAALYERILADGKITFAEFMETCLYSGHGYYDSGRANIGLHGGKTGDFLTSPEMHPSFGATIGNVLYGLWTADGSPEEFQIVEMGAGNGTLAASKYVIVEHSAELIRRQRQRLSNRPVGWVNGSAIELPLGGVNGVCISNELPDVFPVHRLVLEDGDVKEVYVTLDDEGHFIETRGEVSEEVRHPRYLHRVQPDKEYAASPGLVTWQHSLGRVLQRGHVLTIDYGLQTSTPHNPRVYAGFLDKNGGPVGYALQLPGVVDITASVDFGLAIEAGAEVGLTPVEHSRQGDYLGRHGFYEERDRIVGQHAAGDDQVAAKTAHFFFSSLIMSENGTGGFEVLLQRKD